MGTPLNSAAPEPDHGFVLLGGGEIRDYTAVLSRIAADDFIICADSGYDHCAALGLIPDLLVGDFDSVRSALPPHIPRIPLLAEKNHTDTTHAIEQAIARGATQMLLAGMLGGRLDHTLANLQSLAWLSRRGVNACLTDGLTDIYAVTNGEKQLSPRFGYYFSLFSLSQRCTGVFITGAKYLLHDHTLTFDEPRAVSNEFLTGTATISVRNGTMAILLVPMD